MKRNRKKPDKPTPYRGDDTSWVHRWEKMTGVKPNVERSNNDGFRSRRWVFK